MIERQMNRATWKWYYRLIRIFRRESEKAFIDSLIYGVGYVRFHDGFVNHVLPQAVALDARNGEVNG